MIILLIFYLIFLLAYVAFNIYAILKVYSMRANADNTSVVLGFYIFIISAIILISSIWISGLDWSTNFGLHLSEGVKWLS